MARQEYLDDGQLHTAVSCCVVAVVKGWGVYINLLYRIVIQRDMPLYYNNLYIVVNGH